MKEGKIIQENKNIYEIRKETRKEICKTQKQPEKSKRVYTYMVIWLYLYGPEGWCVCALPEGLVGDPLRVCRPSRVQ